MSNGEGCLYVSRQLKVRRLYPGSTLLPCEEGSDSEAGSVELDTMDYAFYIAEKKLQMQ